eukprot:4451726-Ditylum_brightwellii.AAC.1
MQNNNAVLTDSQTPSRNITRQKVNKDEADVAVEGKHDEVQRHQMRTVESQGYNVKQNEIVSSEPTQQSLTMMRQAAKEDKTAVARSRLFDRVERHLERVQSHNEITNIQADRSTTVPAETLTKHQNSSLTKSG